MGLLVRLFPTENFSELLSSKFKDGTTVEVFFSEKPSHQYVPFRWASQPKILPESKERLYGLTSALHVTWRERTLLIWQKETYNGHTAVKRRDVFVQHDFEETSEDFSLLVSCAFSGKKDMCKKSLDIERLQYYQSTVYMYGFPSKPIQWAK